MGKVVEPSKNGPRPERQYYALSIQNRRAYKILQQKYHIIINPYS